MKRFTRIAACFGAAWSVLALAAPGAMAQKTFTLRFNHVLGPNEPYHQGFQT